VVPSPCAPWFYRLRGARAKLKSLQVAIPRPARDWLVAFDLEDTLYPEESWIRSGYAAIEGGLKRLYGADGFAAKAWSWYKVGERERALAKTLEEMGLPHDRPALEFVERLYVSHTPQIQIYPDVLPALETLHMRAAVAIVTDGPPTLQRRKIDALKIDHFIHRVVFTEEWGIEFRKPHARGFQELQDWMGLPAHKCMYVGDDPARDFAGPRKLGWHVLRIRRRDGVHAAVEIPDSLGMIGYCRDFTNFKEFVMFQDPEAQMM